MAFEVVVVMMCTCCGTVREVTSLAGLDNKREATGNSLRPKSTLLRGLVKGSSSLESVCMLVSGTIACTPRSMHVCWYRRLATSGWFLAIATDEGDDPYCEE